MFIGAIADDLTGATDLALMLSRGGLRVIQTVGVPRLAADFGDAEAVVVALKSRTIPAVEAVEQSVAAAKVLLAAGARQLFFKYCSTFDSTDEGNIGPVTDALLALVGENRTIACPAFPANKRTVYQGHLFVGDVLLSDSSMRNHPLTPMRDANLVRVLQRQTRHAVSLISRDTVAQGSLAVGHALAALDGIAIVDAISETDLRTIGRAAHSLKLVTGGSGVAIGLPDNFRTSGKPPVRRATLAAVPGRAVILAGSCSVATRGQIEAALAAGLPALQIDPLKIVSGELTVETAVSFARNASGGVPLIYSSADPEEVAAVQEKLGRCHAGEIVEAFLGNVAKALLDNGFARFLVAGGETSGAVVAALGVEALEIGPEIDPGVPWTVSRGSGKAIALALKSGNFGAEDFFTKAWALLE